MAAVRAVLQAPTAAFARELAFDVADGWRSSAPKVAELVEEGIDACLNVYAPPSQHQRRLHTTNALERFNQEIKRRIRVIRIFPAPASCLRLITSLFTEQSEVAGRKCLNVTPPEETAELDREEMLAA